MINFLNLTEYLLIKKSSFEKNLFHDDAADDIQIWESTFLSLSTFLCPRDSPIILSLSLFNLLFLTQMHPGFCS